MKKISETFSYGGKQAVYSHKSNVNNCDMTFAIYTPPNAKNAPILWYLSGLTCSHVNVMEKGEYRQKAAQLGLVVICPDTSPRGENIPDEEDNWQFGSGAGFYLDATNNPYDKNYNMYSYITTELPQLIESNFEFDMSRQSICGHSMGGHGALIMALRNPKKYKSCSAFAPNGYSFPEILIDQGLADSFLEEGLRPWLLEEACKNTDINLKLRMQPHYDHSYYFISTFMADHLEWHKERI